MRDHLKPVFYPDTRKKVIRYINAPSVRLFGIWLIRMKNQITMKYDFISETMDQVYRQQMAEMRN